MNTAPLSKIFTAVFFLALVFLPASVLADESSLQQKLDMVLMKQDRINEDLRTIREDLAYLKEEMRIVKVRASNK